MFREQLRDDLRVEAGEQRVERRLVVEELSNQRAAVGGRKHRLCQLVHVRRQNLAAHVSTSAKRQRTTSRLVLVKCRTLNMGPNFE